MTASSFRRNLELAPLDYRTPSPPIRDFEPISPGTEEWSKTWSEPLQRFARASKDDEHQQTAGSAYTTLYAGVNYTDSAIEDDTLPDAPDIAQPLDLSLQSYHASGVEAQPDTRAGNDIADQKARYDGRHEQNNIYPEESDTRRLEAELLLNFSREACNKARSYSMSSLTAQRPDGQIQQLLVEQSPLASSGQAIAFDTLTDSVHPASSKEVKTQKTTLPPALNQPKKEQSPPVLNGQNARDNQSNSSEGDVEAGHKAGNGTDNFIPSTGRDKDKEKSVHPTASETNGHVQDVEPVSKDTSTAHSEPLSVSLSDPKPTSKFLDGIEEAAKVDPTQSTDSTTQACSTAHNTKTSISKQKHDESPSICAACHLFRNDFAGQSDGENTSWICCDGCKSWFHFACAGFNNEREVRAVDKFRCRKCKPIHGATTYVRKSARAHSAIDYAGLNEGIIKSSDENPEHHYIKPIKEGSIKFDPENFVRMRPELVTADYFEKGDGMKEPIVIPAVFNPQPRHIPPVFTDNQDASDEMGDDLDDLHDVSVLDEWRSEGFEYEQVQDCGQDSLDMVIPRDLTVRKVSELYGPEEKIEVIDVKSQNGEDKKWNMKRWVDYYEAQGNKPVRNVISLEVSQSKLGRLIRRPKVVRDLDLQDAVWPADLTAKGDYPKVQFYCLMSVADCYTDFHIDFGGSSVYYHILKGKKTFFFIPPHEKHLKKYEEWCNSPAQNWTFLGDQTKECYRVDLSEGDTMLIPAGWIHAVWTPEDSLVIGGNFLTRMHYAMQIRVTQIEKATHVARKFRYPFFQKIMWYTAIRYLEDDPLPDTVRESLEQGQEFQRDFSTYMDFDGHTEESEIGTENFHARYYSKAELDGVPDLSQFLKRTAFIAAGYLTDGITAEARNAVKRSIPKVCGEPLELAKKFAMWVAWKRGNETIPHWAYPGFVPENSNADGSEKKLSVRAMKKLDREAALQAWKVAPDRQSTRPRNQPQNFLAEVMSTQTSSSQSTKMSTPVSSTDVNGSLKRKADSTPQAGSTNGMSTPSKKPRTASGQKPSTNRRPACEACRKGRRACKHRDDPPIQVNGGLLSDPQGSIEVVSTHVKTNLSLVEHNAGPSTNGASTEAQLLNQVQYGEAGGTSQPAQYISDIHVAKFNGNGAAMDTHLTPPKSSGRSKACKDCRKSKRRCVHDEFGNEDPAKLEQQAIPRPAAKKKRLSGEMVDSPASKKGKKLSVDGQANGVGSAAPVAQGSPNAVQEDVPESPQPPPFESFIDPRLEEMTIDMAPPPQEVPAPVDNEVKTPEQEAQSSALPSAFNPEDEVNLIATSPISDLKVEHQLDQEVVPSSSALSHPVASSLVSPPESTHTDAERTPPAASKPRGITPPATSGSSRHSSRPAKNNQRYTPESGSVRRASVSSTGQVNGRDSASPAASVGQVPTHKRTKSRVNSQTDADEESLRLIRELQAQDMGLRRRGRGS